MKTFSFQRELPSCTLNRSLILEIEKKLLFGIPRLLQKLLRIVLQGLGLNDHKKLESYQVIVTTKQTTRNLQSAREMSTPYFENKTKKVAITYKLGAPKIIAIEILFTENDRPKISMTTQSPQIETLFPVIADGVSASIIGYRNRHTMMHNMFVQAALVLCVPALVMVYGLYSGIDLFLLAASMGWLCILLLGLTNALPHIFPWVTFETRRRFQLNRLPLLLKFSVITFALGCYIAFVLLLMPHTTGPTEIVLAGVVDF